jgi:hypothetical protein
LDLKSRVKGAAQAEQRVGQQSTAHPGALTPAVQLRQEWHRQATSTPQERKMTREVTRKAAALEPRKANERTSYENKSRQQGFCAKKLKKLDTIGGFGILNNKVLAE